jgi:hypothetical protein
MSVAYDATRTTQNGTSSSSAFDFRQNTRARLGIDDVQRTALAVKASKGKRLTYQTTA